MLFGIREHSHMTSALGGGLGNLQILLTNSTDRLREMRTRGREDVQNPENFADVLYEWSLSETCKLQVNGNGLLISQQQFT